MRWVLASLLTVLAACTAGTEVSYTPEDYQVALDAVNQARAQARTCANGSGTTDYQATRPLTWNGLLGEVARRRAEYIQQTGQFSHYEGGSSQPAMTTHAQQVGYRYQELGENLAMGYEQAHAAVSAWLESNQGHCDTLMKPKFTEMGMVKRGAYWVLVVGQPKP